jgi:hypothetical protein
MQDFGMTSSPNSLPPPIAGVPAEFDAIGGYFGLERTGATASFPHGSAQGFQSARAAFLALLEAGRPSRVWVPWYLCDSMREPLRQAHIAWSAYALTADFNVDGRIDLQPGQWLLHVNYFGLCDEIQQQLLAEYPAAQLVFDNAQALFCPPTECLATLYSPRKFVGVADGGLLVCQALTIADYPVDVDSGSRVPHLLRRDSLGAQAGYAEFARAEQSLSNQAPRRMSRLTSRLLEGLPYEEIAERRRANFQLVANHLDQHNQLRWSLGTDRVPLCYPFLPAETGLRDELIRARIFVPRYWPELLDDRTGASRAERIWADALLPLPIDQRYDEEHLLRHMVRPILHRLTQCR